MAKKIQPGDVLEITASNGLIYIQYLGKHTEYGDAVIISPKNFTARPVVDFTLFKDSYFVFYPASSAVVKKLAVVIGTLPSPPIPQRLRRPAARSGRKVDTWIIEDSAGERVTSNLTKEEQYLPIAVIWNHEFLLKRTSEGLFSKNNSDIKDQKLNKRDLPSPIHSLLTGIVHYLYFPKEEIAMTASIELKGMGFDVEIRLSTDLKNWLVLAHQKAENRTKFHADIMEKMALLAEKFGGEYDGWEKKIEPQRE